MPIDLDKLNARFVFSDMDYDYDVFDSHGKPAPNIRESILQYGIISHSRLPESRTTKLTPLEAITRKSGRKQWISGIGFTPGAKAGTIDVDIVGAAKGRHDHAGRGLRHTIALSGITPKQAYALRENLKANPALLYDFGEEALYSGSDKGYTVRNFKPDKVKEFLAKMMDTSSLNLKPGQTIRIFDDPEQRAATLARRKENYDKLKGLLKVRKFRNLGLLTAGAGAAGTAGSLLDDKDRMLSAGLSTAAGAAALPTGLAALGGKKLNRLITRKPLVGLAAGALGGLGGFFGNKTIQDALDK
jgi:hypothetical protein